MSSTGDLYGSISALAPDRTSLATEVAAQIRSQILDGSLPPGTPLRQEQLANRLSVSRTPLKEALRLLEAEGLVTTASGATARVVQLTRAQAQEVWEVREYIDGLVARRLATQTLPDGFLAEADQLVELLETSAQSCSRTSYLSYNLEFHSLLLTATGHHEVPRLLPTLRISAQVLYLQTWAHSSGRLKHSAYEHRAILQAINDRKPDQAEKLARAHIDNASRFWSNPHTAHRSGPEDGRTRSSPP